VCVCELNVSVVKYMASPVELGVGNCRPECSTEAGKFTTVCDGVLLLFDVAAQWWVMYIVVGDLDLWSAWELHQCVQGDTAGDAAGVNQQQSRVCCGFVAYADFAIIYKAPSGLGCSYWCSVWSQGTCTSAWLIPAIAELFTLRTEDIVLLQSLSVWWGVLVTV